MAVVRHEELVEFLKALGCGEQRGGVLSAKEAEGMLHKHVREAVHVALRCRPLVDRCRRQKKTVPITMVLTLVMKRRPESALRLTRGHVTVLIVGVLNRAAKPCSKARLDPHVSMVTAASQTVEAARLRSLNETFCDLDLSLSCQLQCARPGNGLRLLVIVTDGNAGAAGHRRRRGTTDQGRERQQQ